MAIFNPPQNPHPLTDHQKIWYRWLRRRPLRLWQIWCKSFGGGLLGKWVKYNEFLFIYTFFTIRYDTIRDAILTCARKPTWVGLIYRTETTTKYCKTEKLKGKNSLTLKVWGNHVVSPEEEKERLQREGFAEKGGFKSGIKEIVGDEKLIIISVAVRGINDHIRSYSQRLCTAAINTSNTTRTQTGAAER